MSELPERKDRPAPPTLLTSELFDEVFHRSSDAMTITRLSDGTFVEANQAFLSAVGLRAEEAIGRSAMELGLWEDTAEREGIMLALRRTGGGKSIPMRLRTSSGEPRLIEASALVISLDGQPHVLTVARDVTERSNLQRLLERSEQRFRVLSEITSDYALEQRISGDGPPMIEWISPRFASDFGMTAEDMNAQGPFSFVHPDDLPRLETDIRRLESEGVSASGEVRVRVQGAWRWFRYVTAAEWDEEANRPRRLYGALQDIHERREVEQALTRSEHLYRELFERNVAGVYLGTTRGEFLAANPALLRILGYPSFEAIRRRRVADFFLDGAERDAIFDEFRREGTVSGKEARVRRGDGQVIWVFGDATLVPGVDGEEDLVQSTVVDISQLKAGEQLLRGSLERLRATDQARRRLLTALVTAQESERGAIGAAIHDGVLQNLATARLQLGLLENELSSLRDHPRLTRVRDVIDVASDGLRGLLTEIHPPGIERGLDAAIERFVHDELLDVEAFSPGVETVSRLERQPPEPLRLLLYRIAQQALRNAVAHAAASRVVVRLGHDDGGYRLQVVDDGVGFEPPAIIASPPGHLGLTSMRERAELAGGRIEIHSAPGGGTTVDVWVPD